MVLEIKGYKVLIDEGDYNLIKDYNIFIAGTTRKYATLRIKGKNYSVHRFILNPPKDLWVDHINGNSLDNRRSNLRLCTPQQNAWNQNVKKRSLPRGVYYRKDMNKVVAEININNKKKHLGYFYCPLIAHKAYRDARIKYMGEFARLEF